MKKTIAWALCALWMGVIFLFSAMPGDVSQAQSDGVSGRLMTLIIRLLGDSAVSAETMSVLVRKAAHMAEYAILFLLYAHALRVSGAKRPFLTAFILSLLYAATDEFHQGFTAERSPMLSDVGIDAIGAGIGCLLRRAYGKMKEEKE